MAEGIEIRIGKDGSRSYRASVWSNRDRKRIRKTFPTMAAAKGWRSDALAAVRRGTLSAPTRTTLKSACEHWLGDAGAGIVTTRSGDTYKPAALASYRRALALRVYPTHGARRLHDVRRVDLQDLVDRLNADGHAPATIQVVATALRAVYKRSLLRGEMDINPTTGLKLPSVRSRRERFAAPSEAATLIAAVPEQDRALWATAFYTGLRRGELMALRWDDVDLEAGAIQVRRGWHPEFGEQETKNRQRRRVPIPPVLREQLVAHRLRQTPGVDLVFGQARGVPFRPERVTRRADRAWTASGLARITLHEARHSYASFAIAAGVNAKALCDYMGHSSIAVTYDKYGHLMPGNEAEAAGLLDAYLERAALVAVAT